jgi:NAD dependent epimerase/dehydratase
MTDIAGRTVLVTGAGGFIGSHLCEVLVERGATVRALCRYTSRRDEGNLTQLDPAVRDTLTVEFGDLRDGDFAGRLVKGTDAVFHLGASISVPYSFVAPREVVMTNVEGTLNMLQAAVDHEVGSYVQMSSSEVYGTAQYTPIDERHPLDAQSPYAASKVGADKLTESFHLSFSLPAVVARPFNTYGPRQSLRAVIPTVISQALAGGTLKLGALSPTRDFVFVRDTVDGLIRLATTPEAAGGTYNIATGVDISVADVVRVVGEILGRELEVEGRQEERMRPEKSEVHQLLGDATRLRELTGWAPQTDLRDGLAAVIEWMKTTDLASRSGAYAI